MARILLLTQVLPYPLNAGPKVRAYHMICHLARTHEVTLVSFVRPDDSPEAIAHLKSICHEVYPVLMRRSTLRNVRASVKGLLTGLPVVIARDEVSEMSATLRWLARKQAFDVVHADQLSMAAYGQYAARMAGSHRPRTLLDEHNAVYVLVQRMADTEDKWLRRVAMTREARAFARYERAMCQAYDAVLTVIPEDLDRLLTLYPPDQREAARGKFTAIPICVDPGQVAPVVHRSDAAPTVLHLGTMFWPPNINGVLWFVREVLPLVRQQEPDARFLVVGKNPPPEVLALGEDAHTEVTGYVADPMPYLEAADAFVVPLHAGGGMRVKILDAWLWGIPVVSTPIGAEGIRVQDGENILIADDAQTFAEAVVLVLRDGTLNQRMRNSGRAWAEANYAWPVVYRQVDQVYTQLLDERP